MGGYSGRASLSPYAMIVPRVVFFVVSHPRVHVSAAGMLADDGVGRGSINFPITSGTEMLVELSHDIGAARGAWHA